METTEIETPLNPLETKTSRTIQGWDEWLALWKAAENFELQWALINAGFSVPVDHEEACARVIFYLRVADSKWRHAPVFLDRITVEQRQAERQRELRDKLSLKAYDVLAEHVFTNKAEYANRAPTWYQYAIEPAVTTQLIEFFAPTPNGYIENLHPWGDLKKDTIQRAGEFLLEFCKLGWGSYLVSNGYGDHWELEPAHEDLQPYFLELLISQGKAQWLMSASKYPFTEASWKKLEELATAETDLPNPENPRRMIKRVPESLEEAIAYGSPAAHLLLVRRIRNAQDEKEIKLIEALKIQAEAAKEVQRLRQS